MIRFFLVVMLCLGAGIAQAQQVSRGGDTATAQGVAELCARHRILRHWGGNRGYEGVGMSSRSPEDALNSCCYSRSGMRVVDQGVARGSDGRWYACKRYTR